MSDDVGRCIALQSVPFFASGEQCQAEFCLHFRFEGFFLDLAWIEPPNGTAMENRLHHIHRFKGPPSGTVGQRRRNRRSPHGQRPDSPGGRPAVHTWNIWQSGYNPGIAPSGRPTHRPVGPQRHCPPCCSARGSSIGCRIAPNCSMWNNLPASGRSTAGIGSGGACSAAPAGSRVRAKGAASTSRTGFCRGRRCAGLRLLIHAKGPSLQSVLRRGAFLVRL